jgi:hypothetical protein
MASIERFASVSIKVKDPPVEEGEFRSVANSPKLSSRDMLTKNGIAKKRRTRIQPSILANYAGNIQVPI